MTYAVVEDVPGGDWDTYARIADEVGEEPIEGLVVHAAGPHDGGVRILSVWSSADHYERFVAARLSPAVGRATGTTADGSRSVSTALEVRHLRQGQSA